MSTWVILHSRAWQERTPATGAFSMVCIGNKGLNIGSPNATTFITRSREFRRESANVEEWARLAPGRQAGRTGRPAVGATWANYARRASHFAFGLARRRRRQVVRQSSLERTHVSDAVAVRQRLCLRGLLRPPLRIAQRLAKRRKSRRPTKRCNPSGRIIGRPVEDRP